MKKNILIFSIAYYPFVGGAEVAVREICRRLGDFKFSIITLRMDRNLPKVEVDGNITIYRIGFSAKRTGSFINLSINWPLTVSKYLFPFWACFRALMLNRRAEFDVAWSIMANYAGFAALFYKLIKPKTLFVLTLQEGDDLEYIKKRVGIFMPIFRKIFHKADKVQAISNFLADFGESMGYQKERIVISNGVDIENFSRSLSEDEIRKAERVLGKKPGEFFIITSSRLVKKNAVDVVINSLGFLPENYKFFIAGTGIEMDELKKLARDLKVSDRVSFGGFVDHKDLPAMLKASDVFVRPSRSEGMGNSFIEAMVAGLPVVATPVGGIPDFLKDGETGLFCKIDDPRDLADKIKLLSKNQELRAEIIRRAEDLASEKYSWEAIAPRMRGVFEEISTPQ